MSVHLGIDAYPVDYLIDVPMVLRLGVQSIERSAQEDTLLVLFNAAVSNMVSYLQLTFANEISKVFTFIKGSL